MDSSTSVNSTLSDSDIETLQSIGHDTIQNIVALVVEAILYTIYFILVVIAGRILLAKGRNKMRIFTFAVVLVMLMLDTAMCIIDVNNAIREITYTLTSNSAASLEDRYNNMVLPWPVENALYAFMSNLGDVIIIWRVYAFWHRPSERWVLIIPSAFLLGSITSSVLISYCVAKLVADPSAGDFINPPFCVNVQIASYSTALVTTAVATAMVCWKTWTYRRKIGSNIGVGNSKTRAEKIMTILIESGVLYFLFFLSAVVDDVGNVPDLETSTPQLAFASTVWTYMSSHILGIYPVLVVILVHSQKSYIDHATSAPSSSLPSQSAQSQSWFSRSDRSYWGSTGRVKPNPGTANRSHVIDIDVHELREVHPKQGASFGEVGVPVFDNGFQSQSELPEKPAEKQALSEFQAA